MPRDDFSEKTKEIAAKRVGYRCSFPGCGSVTVGASMEGIDKISSIGEAAHICAASPGGKRYDSNMTPDERKSIDNCIWMCRTHARLIDTDENTYTVDILKEWKNKAERNAAIALADVDFLRSYYDSHGDSLEIITGIFESLIIEGEFDILLRHINQYTSSLSKEYDEFVFRYKVLYDVYCNRSNINHDLKQYLSTSRTGIDRIVEELLAFALKAPLKIVIEFCEDTELVKLAHIIINDQLDPLFLTKQDKDENVAFTIKYHSLVEKIITNYIFDIGLFEVKYQNGKIFKLYDQEFYYDMQAALYEIQYRIIHLNLEYDEITEAKFDYIVKNLNRWNKFDTIIITKIWGVLLFYALDNQNKFDELYDKCPCEIKKTPDIFELYCGYLKKYDSEKFDINEILEFCQKSKEYELLADVLYICNHQEGMEFLNEHQFLYKENSCFLHLKLIVYSDCNETEDVETFLKRYDLKYYDDIIYHSLCAYFTNDEEIIRKEIQWLKGKVTQVKYRELTFLIDVFARHNQWDILCDLANVKYHNKFLYQISIQLLKSIDMTHILKSNEIIDNLIDAGFKTRGLYHNKAYICRKQGALEKAKEYYKLEYDQNTNISSLINFIDLRCETKEFIEDYYLEKIKNIIDSEVQHMIGYIYHNLNKYIDACIFCLRALLIDDNNVHALNGFLISGLQIELEEVTNVREDTVCVLKNDYERIQVAVYSPEIIKDISPNEFANCSHYSADQLVVSNLIYCEEGDKTIFRDQEYTIDSISSLHKTFMHYAVSKIEKIPGITIVSAASPEESIEEMKKIMSTFATKTENIIHKYNSMQILGPLSVLSHNVGRDMITTFEFLLYGNTEKIRNNPSVYDEKFKDKKIVLSFESIIILGHLNLLEIVKNTFALLCPQQVKQRLLVDIQNELHELSSEHSAGILSYINERLSIIEHTKESRRERRAFLVKLQSFINSITTGEPYDFTYSDTELCTRFSERQMFCENGCLGLAQNTEDCILVSDDQFIYSMANFLGIKNIGICSLLCACNLSWEKLLDCSQKLANMNFSNYFPIDLYNEIYYLASKIPDGGNLDKLSEWYRTDKKDKPSEHHRKVIIELFSKVIITTNDDLCYDYNLGRNAVEHFRYLYPDEYKRRIRSILTNMGLEIEDQSNNDEEK